MIEKNNYYYGRLTDIIKLANETKSDWGVALSIYDNKHGAPENADEQRKAFLSFVRGKSFAADGSYRYVWKDGSLHDEPEKA